jgi:hypothetical protein
VRLELEQEEARELVVMIIHRLIEESGLGDQDRASLRRWRSEGLKGGSEAMRELTAKINADIDRVLKTKEKSAIMKPDWK